MARSIPAAEDKRLAVSPGDAGLSEASERVRYFLIEAAKQAKIALHHRWCDENSMPYGTVTPPIPLDDALIEMRGILLSLRERDLDPPQSDGWGKEKVMGVLG